MEQLNAYIYKRVCLYVHMCECIYIETENTVLIAFRYWNSLITEECHSSIFQNTLTCVCVIVKYSVRSSKWSIEGWMKCHFQHGSFFISYYILPKLWHMNGPTLLSSQGSKKHAYKEDQAIWIALSNSLFFPVWLQSWSWSHHSISFCTSVDGMEKWIFFQILSITET